ncbi:hypothetical protein [Brevundimonas olei]|uniref:PBECR3 domain-containing polyvalent protein n=1 Tax=Brevundimonas olei TaxID=657642 RepID=UPI0031E40365
MKSANRKAKPIDLILGPLPTDQINQALGLELEPGDIILSAGAQKHASKRHPDEYARCQPHVAAVALDPLYVGNDFRNEGKIELVSRVAALGGGMLVAVCIEPDAEGNYSVTSFYPVSEKKIENRRQSRHLILLPRK